LGLKKFKQVRFDIMKHSASVHYKYTKISIVAYNQKIADRIRKSLATIPNVEEKQMMGGLTFMVNDKMCVGIFKDEMMCRIDPELHDSLIKKPGCRTMDFTNRPMIGYVVISDTGMKTQKQFNHWIELALEFNKKAKASKKRKKHTL
jgi:TfoX/Sxy family transcriptional regulator of competence genes